MGKGKHYVIGDVHGNLKCLLELVNKIPKNSNLIFVGDLIDRGEDSAGVIDFVKKGGHSCVLGNHEDMMLEDFPLIIKACYEKTLNFNLLFSSIWMANGGFETIKSYGIELNPQKEYKKSDFFKIEEDFNWIKSLPLYIELDTKNLNIENNLYSQKKIIISHSSILHIWKNIVNNNNIESEREHILWNRFNVDGIDADVFNIFGHTPIKNGPFLHKNYINVDTGCYMKKEGYSKLTAYCIETGEILSVNNIY